MIKYFLQAWHRIQNKIKPDRVELAGAGSVERKSSTDEEMDWNELKIWFLKSKIMKQVRKVSYVSLFSNKCHEQTANQPLQSSVHMHISDDWSCLCSIYTVFAYCRVSLSVSFNLTCLFLHQPVASCFPECLLPRDQNVIVSSKVLKHHWCHQWDRAQTAVLGLGLIPWPLDEFFIMIGSQGSTDFK